MNQKRLGESLRKMAKENMENGIVAVPFEAGMVFQHFGKTAAFKLYTIVDGQVSASVVECTDGTGHGALASWLACRHVDVVLCGGIGAGAVQALEEASVKVVAGVAGEADKAVAGYLAGTLVFFPFATCHHDHGHDGGCGGNGHCHAGGC